MATTLLLADDSPTIAKILLLALQSEPYEIKSVLTAEDALHALKHNPPYFFLCDLTLPGKNGYEFARLIRQDSKLNKIRVVLLASAFEPVDEIEYQACGADGLIKKPFDPSELRSKLRSIHDAPPKFPDGSKVTGSLSGFLVNREKTNPELTTPPLSAPTQAAPTDDLSSLLQGHPSSEASADSILAGLLGGGNESFSAQAESPSPIDLVARFQEAKQEAAPPPFSPKEPEPILSSSINNSTVLLDVSETPPPPPEAPQGVSASFSTPPGGTALVDISLMGAEPLSAKAEALAAFFAAEIQTQDRSASTPPNAPKASVTPQEAAVTAADQEFEASLGSIDWQKEGPADSSLNAWSSSQPKSEAPPAAPPRKKTSGAAEVGNMLFDTGGSSFRFSEDYVNRITKAFTGVAHEEVPEAHAPIFHQKSDDRGSKQPAPGFAGGGAWSEDDVQRIERIVREEVQMVVREVAEKIAWEVIPELAENIIRKELDKVLKEMEPS